MSFCIWISFMSPRRNFVWFALLMTVCGSACEIPTTIKVEGGNPPVFRMSGSGSLGRLVVRGPKAIHDITGPDAAAYWYIKVEQHENVARLSPLTYGKTPAGYVQIYPESGDATPLVENEIYYLQIDAADAPGIQGYFVIRNGKVRFANDRYELEEKGNGQG